MSREQSIDERRVTTTAEPSIEKVSVYLTPTRGEGLIESIKELFEPDLTHGAMIRCDWNGDGNNFGTFEVKGTGDDSWKGVGELAPSGPNVQLVSSYHEVTKVHVQRGPTNPGVRFAVKLVPIKWNTVLVMPQHHGVLVTAGTHYDYDGVKPADVAWKHSAPDSQGKHFLTLQNIQGRDYEIWVKLWHPDGTEVTKEQDPVIRTGANIPSGSRGNSGMSGSHAP